MVVTPPAGNGSARIVPRPPGRWSKPNDGVVLQRGNSLIIGKRLWQNVPELTLARVIGTEQLIKDIQSQDDVFGKWEGNPPEMPPEIMSEDEQPDPPEGEFDETDDPSGKIVSRVWIEFDIVERLVSRRPFGGEALEFYRELQERINRLIKEEEFSYGVLEEDVPPVIDEMLEAKLSEMLDRKVPGQKLVIDG